MQNTDRWNTNAFFVFFLSQALSLFSRPASKSQQSLSPKCWSYRLAPPHPANHKCHFAKKPFLWHPGKVRIPETKNNVPREGHWLAVERKAQIQRGGGYGGPCLKPRTLGSWQDCQEWVLPGQLSKTLCLKIKMKMGRGLGLSGTSSCLACTRS